MPDSSKPSRTAVAGVMLNRGERGVLQATFYEFPDRIPAPRRQIAEALLGLVQVLLDDADELDATDGDIRGHS